MKDFIVPEKLVTDDKDLEKRIRAAINVWAAGYKIEAFKRLGEEINIDRIHYRPAYPIHLQTQYEKRLRFADHKPYTNQKVPPRVYPNLDSVNPWDVPIQLPDHFVEKEASFMVDGSQHVLNCFECKGSGRVTCPTCKGSGKQTCGRCNGSGKEKCSTCNGSGQVESSQSCSACSGRGQWYQSEYRYDSSLGRSVSHQVHYTCSNCGGSGRRNVRVRCSSCGGNGQLTCKSCGGSGKVTCVHCHGSGQIVCPVCEGKGQLYHYYAVRQTLTSPVTSQMGVCSEFNRKFAEFVENWEQYDCEKVHVVDCENEMVHPLEDGHVLYDLVKKQLEDSHQKAPATRLLFQRMTFYRIDAWSVGYTYKGEKYSMLFHGKDLNIIPAKSPIYDYCQSLVDKAVDQYNKGKVTASGWLMSKARHINSYELRNRIAELSQTVKDTLGKAYSGGAFIGALLTGLVSAFALFAYCRDYNHMMAFMAFFNKAGGWLFGYHPATMGILGLLMAWPGYTIASTLGKKWLERFIPTHVLRLLIGILLGVLATSLCVGVLWLTNLVGLTMLATLALWFIWLLIRIFLGLLVLIWKVLSWIWNLIF